MWNLERKKTLEKLEMLPWYLTEMNMLMVKY